MHVFTLLVLVSCCFYLPHSRHFNSPSVALAGISVRRSRQLFSLHHCCDNICQKQISLSLLPSGHSPPFVIVASALGLLAAGTLEKGSLSSSVVWQEFVQSVLPPFIQSRSVLSSLSLLLSVWPPVFLILQHCSTVVCCEVLEYRAMASYVWKSVDLWSK
ncbi:uncharacterized protein LOC114717946 isoform X2 [Neltuma alba]|uniref:uncharacterized protein LOC114717946 isoform X2 n=1 Tax=Neltuma alba TaxID=207710 RepID=UPI0010A4F17A|nr:uncharacterized protein LOC114717946 isoform X2 [Prosopis alba]